MQGIKLTIVTVTKRPFFVRNEMGLAGKKMIMGFDGESAGMAAGRPSTAAAAARTSD